jgi:AraC-like DNA-binding protein
MNKGTVQVYDDLDGIEGISILFTDAFFYQIETDARFLKNSTLFNNLLSVATITPASPFPELLVLMQNEVKQIHDNFQPSLLRNYLHSFLMEAERIRSIQNVTAVSKGPDYDYVILFRDLLENGFKNHKQVSYYASLLSVTEKRLNTATAKVLGKTPKQLIDNRVMLEAKRLLAHAHDSIKEVGFCLGFEEPTNFIKYFRKHNQQTPVEFRESLLKS